MWINWKIRGKRDLVVLEGKKEKKNPWKIEAEKKKKKGSVEEKK